MSQPYALVRHPQSASASPYVANQRPKLSRYAQMILEDDPIGWWRLDEPQKTSDLNLVPNWDEWILGGNAYIDGDTGDLVLPNYGDYARSPTVDVPPLSAQPFSLEGYTDVEGPQPRNDPGYSSFYLGSSYMDADGNSVESAAGWTGNGWAPPNNLPVGVWTRVNWTPTTGDQVKKVYFQINCHSSYTAEGHRYRQPQIASTTSVGNDIYERHYVPVTNLKDASGNANDMVVIGGPALDKPSPLFKGEGRSGRFSVIHKAQGDTLRGGQDLGDAETGAGPFSLEVWYNSLGSKGMSRQDILQIRGDNLSEPARWSDSVWISYINNRFYAYWRRHDASNWGNTYSPVLTSAYDTWYHVVYTYDGTTNRLFINGELVGAIIQPPAALENIYSILGVSSGTVMTDGDVGEPAVYLYALADTQIERHYGVGLGVAV